MGRARSYLLGASLILLSRGTVARAEDQQVSADPYSWLEELQGQRSIDWVNAHTATTLAELTKAPEFPSLFADIKRVLDSRETIAYPQIVGERLYNLEQDENHPRGLWRWSSWDSYLRGTAAWHSVLDLDSLARADRVAWNFVGAECLEPENRYCMLELDRDGSDSSEIRGLDVDARKFVRIQANIPAPARISRLARSEMPNAEASREATRYSDHPSLETRRRLQQHGEPADGDVFMVLDQVIVYVHEPWTVGGKTWQPGSIIATSFGDFLTAKKNFSLVLKPGPREAIESVSATRDYLLVNVLNNVCGELRRYRHDKDKWSYETVRVPKLGSVAVISTSTTMNRFFFTYTSFLQPTTLYLADDDGKAREIKSLPSTFNAADVIVEQSEATSKDGTKIPFFIVHRRSMPRDGTNPTLLYAYGGFALSSTPAYGTAVGPAWIGRGGVYVVANIRGGGEFGSDWHTAGIKENRQRVYDDFTAVAEELLRQRVTSPEHLGIMGASNGGLLVGVAITERPDLFKAAVVQSALLDMQRYTHLLGGAHWIPEYGDPDKAEDWAYISKYSPYQNLRSNTKYPAVLFVTNMLDDRVHPAHARKMAAKMESMGSSIYYFENATGGHSSGLTSEEKARTLALAYTFLWQQLQGAR